jgi:hypothetical protein
MPIVQTKLAEELQQVAVEQGRTAEQQMPLQPEMGG